MFRRGLLLALLFFAGAGHASHDQGKVPLARPIGGLNYQAQRLKRLLQSEARVQDLRTWGTPAVTGKELKQGLTDIFGEGSYKLWFDKESKSALFFDQFFWFQRNKPDGEKRLTVANRSGDYASADLSEVMLFGMCYNHPFIIQRSTGGDGRTRYSVMYDFHSYREAEIVHYAKSSHKLAVALGDSGKVVELSIPLPVNGDKPAYCVDPRESKEPRQVQKFTPAD